MAISGINAAAGNGSTVTSGAASTNNVSINDFFQLMAAQLENQSMYDTVDNTQFLAQLAQFTTLSQITELTNAVKSNTAVSYIGKQVVVPDLTDSSAYLIGTVGSVSFTDGIPYLFVGDAKYELSQILEIGPSADGSTPTDPDKTTPDPTKPDESGEDETV